VKTTYIFAKQEKKKNEQVPNFKITSKMNHLNQKLLSQFLFLLDKNCLSTEILFSKLSQQTTNFIKSDALKSFLQNCNTNQHEQQEELKREEFNCIILDMINEITITNNTNNNDMIEQDLQYLVTSLFSQEASVSMFWKATEQSRWRSTAFQKESNNVMMLNNNSTDDSNQQNATVAAGKLIFGIMMATEL
jgi:hypothetical protein